MKTKAQLIEARKALVVKMEEILNAGKSEKRKLSAAEKDAFDAVKKEIEDLDTEIRQKTDTPPVPVIKMGNSREQAKDFSLLTAIRKIANNEDLDDSTKAFIAKGKEDMRAAGLQPSNRLILPMEHRAAIQASASNSGIEAISEEKLDMIGPLRDALVLSKAGATMLTGLKGNVSIPVYAGTTAAWKGEGVTAADGAGATSEVTLGPKRITVFIDISNLFLTQDTTGADALFKQDIIDAIAGKLEATVLGKENVSADQPLGLFYTAPGLKGAASWANIVGLETAVDTANALQNCSYITNPGGVGLLKTTNKVANQNGYLMDPDGKLNSYNVFTSGHVAKALQSGSDEYGIIFANWKEFLLAQWGAIDIKVDTITRAAFDETRLVVNSYWDAKFRRSNAYKTGSIK